MRIAFYNNWYVRQVIPVANALAVEHDVLLIAPAVTPRSPEQDGLIPEHQLRSRLHPRVELHLLHGMQGLRPDGLLALFRAAGLLRAFRPDVLHLQESYDFRSLALTYLHRAMSVTLTVHDPIPHRGERISLRRFKHWVRDRTRHRADALLVLGESLRGNLHDASGIPLDRIAAVQHPSFAFDADTERQPRRDGTQRVLFFGRWEAYKGLDVLIAAAGRLRGRFPHARFVLAGEGRVALGDLRPLMEDPSQFEILNHTVPDDEVPKLFAEASMLVLPYTSGSQSGPLHLASQFGLPVVASRIGAIPDVVEDGVTGLLVSPGDAADLANAVGELLADPERAKAMGTAGLMASRSQRSDSVVAAEHLSAYAAARLHHSRRYS